MSKPRGIWGWLASALLLLMVWPGVLSADEQFGELVWGQEVSGLKVGVALASPAPAADEPVWVIAVLKNVSGKRLMLRDSKALPNWAADVLGPDGVAAPAFPGARPLREKEPREGGVRGYGLSADAELMDLLCVSRLRAIPGPGEYQVRVRRLLLDEKANHITVDSPQVALVISPTKVSVQRAQAEALLHPGAHGRNNGAAHLGARLEDHLAALARVADEDDADFVRASAREEMGALRNEIDKLIAELDRSAEVGHGTEVAERLEELWVGLQSAPGEGPYSSRGWSDEQVRYLREMRLLGVAALPGLMAHLQEDVRRPIWIPVDEGTGEKRDGGDGLPRDRFPELTDLLVSPVRGISGKRLALDERSDRYSRPATRAALIEWWRAGMAGTRERFDRLYVQWQDGRGDSDRVLLGGGAVYSLEPDNGFTLLPDLEDETKAGSALRKIEWLGKAALPLMVEKFRAGDYDMVPLMAKMTGAAACTMASRPGETVESRARDCLAWWEANKDEWTIPFPDAGDQETAAPAPEDEAQADAGDASSEQVGADVLSRPPGDAPSGDGEWRTSASETVPGQAVLMWGVVRTPAPVTRYGHPVVLRINEEEVRLAVGTNCLWRETENDGEYQVMLDLHYSATGRDWFFPDPGDYSVEVSVPDGPVVCAVDIRVTAPTEADQEALALMTLRESLMVFLIERDNPDGMANLRKVVDRFPDSPLAGYAEFAIGAVLMDRAIRTPPKHDEDVLFGERNWANAAKTAPYFQSAAQNEALGLTCWKARNKLALCHVYRGGVR